MDIKNAKRWAKAGSEPYVVGVFGYFAAFTLRHALHPLLDDHIPLLFFAINCVFIAFRYGFWPSFWILIFSTPTAFFFFVKPLMAYDGLATSDVFILIVNCSLVICAAGLLEWVRREQYRATLLARVSDSRYRLLIEADEDRREAIRRSVSLKD